MKIAVLGATGGTGSLVVRAARDAGHELTVLVRDPSRLASTEGLRVIAGDATVRADVDRALDGQEGLVSALGSRSLINPDIAARAARVFVPSAEAHGLRRLVEMSAFGVGETSAQAGVLMRAAFATLLRRYHRDKSDADDIVRRSTLDWTIVQPVVLSDGAAVGRVVAATRLPDGARRTVSRADVADFLVGCLVSPEWSRTTVVVAS